MVRPINPANSYSAIEPCQYDGTYQRYLNSGECCECKKRWQEQESGPIHRTNPQHRTAENKAARRIFDPTIGGVFADSIRDRVRAGK